MTIKTRQIDIKLDLDIFDIDFDDYKKKDNQNCYFCGLDLANNSLNTYLHEEKKIVKTCCFCNIVINFKIQHIEDVLIGTSNLSQLEIIQKTIKYIIKNETFPSILDIDKDAKLVNILSYKFVKYYSTLSEQDKSKNRKYKIFFMGSKNIIKYANKFIDNKMEFNLKIEKLEKEEFNKQIINQNDIKLINQYQEEFNQELNKVKKYNNFVDNLRISSIFS